jgi:hypothetical protein
VRGRATLPLPSKPFDREPTGRGAYPAIRRSCYGLSIYLNRKQRKIRIAGDCTPSRSSGLMRPPLLPRSFTAPGPHRIAGLQPRHTFPPVSLPVNELCADWTWPAFWYSGRMEHASPTFRKDPTQESDTPGSHTVRLDRITPLILQKGVLLHDRGNGGTPDIMALDDPARVGLRGGLYGYGRFHPGMMLCFRSSAHSQRPRRKGRCTNLSPRTLPARHEWLLAQDASSIL